MFKSMTIGVLSQERMVAFRQNVRSTTMRFVQRLSVHFIAPRGPDSQSCGVITRLLDFLEERLPYFSNLKALKIILDLTFLDTAQRMQAGLDCPCWTHLSRVLQKAQNLRLDGVDISIELECQDPPRFLTFPSLDRLAAHFDMPRGPRIILTQVGIWGPPPVTADSLPNLSNTSSIKLIDGLGACWAVRVGTSRVFTRQAETR